MMNDYFNRGGQGTGYNYDLAPLIENFTFYDFIKEGMKIKEHQDFGGFLVITNNQYIVGYTKNFGKGTHLSAYARTMNDINERGYIRTDAEALSISNECQRNYITARIVCEYKGDNENRIATYESYINFDFSKLGYKITPEQFETFKEFYNTYNEDIKYVSKRYGFYVRFSYKDENGSVKYNISNDLDTLYNYLSQNIDYNKTAKEEIIIIGKERKNKTK